DNPQFRLLHLQATRMEERQQSEPLPQTLFEPAPHRSRPQQKTSAEDAAAQASSEWRQNAPNPQPPNREVCAPFAASDRRTKPPAAGQAAEASPIRLELRRLSSLRSQRRLLYEQDCPASALPVANSAPLRSRRFLQPTRKPRATLPSSKFL